MQVDGKGTKAVKMGCPMTEAKAIYIVSNWLRHGKDKKPGNH